MNGDTPTGGDALAMLGAMALGSRVKRLADTILGQAATTLKDEGLPLTTSQVIALTVLSLTGPLTVTDFAERLGVSQPAVTRLVHGLKEQGLLALSEDREDGRQIRLTLTDQGRALSDRMDDFRARAETAARALFEGAQGDFLTQIAHVERALARQSFDRRVGDLRKAQLDDQPNDTRGTRAPGNAGSQS